VRSLEALQRAAAISIAAVMLATLGWRCLGAPDVAFLTGPDWIANARPVDAHVEQWRSPTVPVAIFARTFELAAVPAHAQLSVRAARAHMVRVNGIAAWSSKDPNPRWRRGTEGDIAPLLHQGVNQLEIAVWNSFGPPLLAATLELPGASLHSGPDWAVSIDGSPQAPAVAPSDVRPHPTASMGPRPAQIASERWGSVVALLLASTLACWIAGALLRDHERWAPAAALAAVHALWLGVFATKLIHVGLSVGFDALEHLRYVDFLEDYGRVPLPTDGWSMYHPPLYYALLAGLHQLAEPLGDAWTRAAVKSVSFIAGLAQTWIALGLSRTLLRGRPVSAAVAVLFAGLVPLNEIMAAAVSNEPLHAALLGAALLLSVRALERPALRPGDVAAIGGVLGLALLTKVSALAGVAAIGTVLAARAVFVERGGPARLAALALCYAAPIAALAGWFFARNWGLYGMLIVGNWNAPGLVWWSQPGFHTAAYYLHFGAVLAHPLFAGFESFGDALYASFWGDGWISGIVDVRARPGHWNWDWVALGYWFALPPSLVLAVGLAASLRRAFGRDEPARAAWSLVLLLEAIVGFALLSFTIDLPYFGQAKAAYALGLVAPLGVSFALGADVCDRALRRIGFPAALCGRALLVAAGACFALAFAG
jgi:hypothetical protein